MDSRDIVDWEPHAPDVTSGRICAALLALAATAANGSLAERLRSEAAIYYARAPAVATITSRYQTMDYYQRLLDDAGVLSDPASQSSPVRLEIVRAQAQLDLSLAQQLASGNYVPMTAIRGAGETLVRASKDCTLQPVAVYVPRNYAPGKPAPLVVFLHGRLQPESQLVAPAFMQQIADDNGTIVVAPYGRGSYDFDGSESDIYDAYDAALRSFAIDRTRCYLVGYSMGAVSVFKIALEHSDDWSALMSIAGALPDAESHSIVAAMHNARFYVVTGGRDGVVLPDNSISTATVLRNAGVPVSLYYLPEGTHGLYTLRSVIARAWSDMLRGVVITPLGL